MIQCFCLGKVTLTEIILSKDVKLQKDFDETLLHDKHSFTAGTVTVSFTIKCYHLYIKIVLKTL